MFESETEQALPLYARRPDFLTKAALNLLIILTPDHRAELVPLAESQVDLINLYAMDPFVLMDAFRRSLVPVSFRNQA